MVYLLTISLHWLYIHLKQFRVFLTFMMLITLKYGQKTQNFVRF